MVVCCPRPDSFPQVNVSANRLENLTSLNGGALWENVLGSTWVILDSG